MAYKKLKKILWIFNFVWNLLQFVLKVSTSLPPKKTKQNFYPNKLCVIEELISASSIPAR